MMFHEEKDCYRSEVSQLRSENEQLKVKDTGKKPNCKHTMKVAFGETFTVFICTTDI